MTELTPYYFDNVLISANLQRVTTSDNEEFVFEVNVNDDHLKTIVSERLDDYEHSIDRWHVATERETDVAEAAEGFEPSGREPDDRSRPTAN